MQADPGRRHALLDTALAGLIAGAVTLAAYAGGPSPGVPDVLLIATGSLALAGHRRAPRVVLVVTTACMIGHVLNGTPGSWAAFPVLAAVHAAARGGGAGRV